MESANISVFTRWCSFCISLQLRTAGRHFVSICSSSVVELFENPTDVQKFIRCYWFFAVVIKVILILSVPVF